MIKTHKYQRLEDLPLTIEFKFKKDKEVGRNWHLILKNGRPESLPDPILGICVHIMNRQGGTKWIPYTTLVTITNEEYKP